MGTQNSHNFRLVWKPCLPSMKKETMTMLFCGETYLALALVVDNAHPELNVSHKVLGQRQQKTENVITGCSNQKKLKRTM